MTHTYIQAIKQSTLGYLTRSVRRRAASPNAVTVNVKYYFISPSRSNQALDLLGCGPCSGRYDRYDRVEPQ